MPVVNRKSTILTNRDAAPRANNPAHLQGGTRLQARATFALVNGDSIASTYRICQLPTVATVNSIRLFCAAVTTCAADVGLYRSTENGAAAVSASCYATAQSLATGITIGTDISYEFKDIANIERRVWEDGGLATDPGGVLDLVMTLSAAAASGGTVSFIVDYTVP